MAYGQDRLEPLLWSSTKHLRQGDSHDALIELLEEFVDNEQHAKINDPVKRAFLQRDVWLVLNWLSETRPKDPRKSGASRNVYACYSLSWLGN